MTITGDGTPGDPLTASGSGGADTRSYDNSVNTSLSVATQTTYFGLFTGSNTESVAKSKFHENVVIKKVMLSITQNTFDVASEYMMRKNGVDTGDTIPIGIGVTGELYIDTNISFSATDDISFALRSTSTATSGAVLPGGNKKLIVQVSGGSPLGVQSVSGNGVDNTDPFNPIITTGNLTSPTSGVTIGTGTNRLIGGNGTISIATASGSQQGLLSAADWTTFNDKADASPTLCIVKAYQSSLNSGGSPFIANTEVFDTTNSYDNTTGIFTAPRTGYYLVSGSFSVESHTVDPMGASAQIIKNGATGVDQDSIRLNGSEGSADFWKRRLKLTSTVQLNATDTIQFNVAASTGSMGVTGGVEGNQINIVELR